MFVISSAQREIALLLQRIRPEWSNIRNGNGRYETICNRLVKKWETIDGLIEKHGPEKLGIETIASIEKERQIYFDLVLRKERSHIS